MLNSNKSLHNVSRATEKMLNREMKIGHQNPYQTFKIPAFFVAFCGQASFRGNKLLYGYQTRISSGRRQVQSRC